MRYILSLSFSTQIQKRNSIDTSSALQSSKLSRSLIEEHKTRLQNINISFEPLQIY